MSGSSHVTIGVALLLLALPLAAQNAEHGADGYKLCASCHGFNGEGNRLVNAPSLAGREAWYLERQIGHFRDGLRGHEDDDAPGRTMAEMTRALTSDDDIRDLVAYIGTLPPPPLEVGVDGDVGNGEALYAACSACHGAAGEGNAALNAPGLTGVDDWYQVRQLEKFKHGLRGAAAADTYGQQMAPMAQLLADEQAMRDVVAYVNSLRSQAQ
ncbi:MAG: c-type cytochrome [Pseudomonadota bacterium]